MPQVFHGVRVHGIKDLQRALRKIDRTLPGELADANQEVAQHVVDEATVRAQTLGPMWAKAARSLSAARQQRVAAIRYGGARYPMAMGAEFGAARNVLRDTSRGLVRGWNQFRPWRGNSGDAGYFLFPTLRRESDEIVDLYGDVLDRLISKHF